MSRSQRAEGREHVPDARSRRGQPESVVQLAIREQAASGGDPGAVELELERLLPWNWKAERLTATVDA
jgi:hypothetical protein